VSQSYTQLSFIVPLLPSEIAYLKGHNDELWAEVYSRFMKLSDPTLHPKYAEQISNADGNKMELWFEALENESIIVDDPNINFVEGGLHVTCDEWIDLDLVCIFLQLVIENYPHLGKIGFEYAVTSDDMTPGGGFGGGVCIVTEYGYQIISTESLLDNKNRAAIEVEWHCPECHTTATWTQFACAESGAPICDSCDGDMCVKE